jgi:hypothetical protein
MTLEVAACAELGRFGNEVAYFDNVAALEV